MSEFTLGLKANGSCWAWGNNDYGALGDLFRNDKSSPVSVVGAHSFSVLSVQNYSSMGLKSDGSCWTWGINSIGGSLGDNTVTSKSSPVSVVGAHSFTQISGGGIFAMGLKSNGECWTWGTNSSTDVGALGDNTTNDRSSPVSVVGAHVFASLYDRFAAPAGPSGLTYNIAARLFAGNVYNITNAGMNIGTNG